MDLGFSGAQNLLVLLNEAFAVFWKQVRGQLAFDVGHRFSNQTGRGAINPQNPARVVLDPDLGRDRIEDHVKGWMGSVCGLVAGGVIDRGLIIGV